MTLTRSFVRNAVMTPLDARLMNMAELVANADGSPRVGVLGYPPQDLVATTATMNVTVAAAEFVCSKGKADGSTVFVNDGSVNVLISAAPVSNSRIDVIWVKHNDDTTGDANALPVFGVTAGTAAAIPLKPSIPTGATELATLRIYAGTTATNGGANVLTQTYQYTAMRGGVVYFRTKADLDAWTTAQTGQLALVIAGFAGTPTLYQWSGLTWAVQGDGLVLLGKTGLGNSASVALDNVFSTPFAFYKIRLQVRGASAAFAANLQLRAGGVNASGGSDYYSQSRSSSGSTTTTVGSAAGAVPLNRAGSYVQLMAEIDINDPATAFRTTGLVRSHAVGGNAGAENTDLSFQHNPANQYDGFRIYSTGGTIQGEVAVYGLIS